MSDAFQHVNRMGDSYRLQSKPGKDGKRKFSFARKLTGEPVQRLPEGYEVREHPESGQVVLRKLKPSPIRAEEKRLLEQTIRKQARGVLFIVDVDDRALVVYTADMEADARVDLLRQIFPMDAATATKMKADMIGRARYMKMMRFTLIDPENRLFNLDRWCFMGSIDDWFFIEAAAPLSVLAGKYVRHLGQESFFDLM
jgi:hypothetical protein